MNNHFKFWGCLAQKSQHETLEHGDCFLCNAVVFQLAINTGKSSLTVDTEIHLITLELLIVPMFLQANTRQQCILSWH